MRILYVRVLRGVRAVLAATGLLALLDRWAARSRTGLWMRSWLAIYDLDEMLLIGRPWWTFEAGDEVERFLADRPDARVFEWGSGSSTVWLAHRAGQVRSVEHDAAWAGRMGPVLPENAALVLAEPGPGRGATAVRSAKRGFAGLDFADYVARLDDVEGDLDLVVVDGRAREACLERALPRLAPGGMVVVDNVERRRYRTAIDHALARHPHLQVRWTRGRTPSLPYPTRTALLLAAPARVRVP